MPGLLILELTIFVLVSGWLAQRKQRPFADGAIVGAVFEFLGLFVVGTVVMFSTSNFGTFQLQVLMAIVGVVFGGLGLLVIGLAPPPKGTPKSMSLLTKILLIVILALLVWLALGAPGL